MFKPAEVRDAANISLVRLPHQSIVVYLFPVDRRLPALIHLPDKSSLRELLRRVAPRLADQADVQLTTLRYKPERRYVAQLAAFRFRRQQSGPWRVRQGVRA